MNYKRYADTAEKCTLNVNIQWWALQQPVLK